MLQSNWIEFCLEIPMPKVIPNFPEPLSESEIFNEGAPGKTDGPPLAGKKVIPKGKSGCLDGINFVISGQFPSLTRDEIKSLIETYGGNVMDSLSENTDVFICGYKKVDSSKVQKAKELKIKITDEDGLFSVIQASNSNSDSSSEYYSTEDEIGAELTPELDLSVNRTVDLLINENKKTSYQEELQNIKNDQQSQEGIMNENEKVLDKLSKEEDETDKFLKEYFGKRVFSKISEITLKDNSSDDIDDFDEALEFEENFNMRYDGTKDLDNEDVQTHPRFVGTEEESARRRKRRIRREQEQQIDNETQKQFDAIEEKYKQIALANNGHLTNEQLSQWADEVAEIELRLQGGAFEYHEVKPEGDALAYLKDDEDEASNDDDDDDDDDRNQERERGNNRKDFNNRFSKRGNRYMGDRGFSRGRGRNDRSRGRRSDPYTAHRQ